MVFKTVVLPSTLPFILTGLRLGVGRAIVGVMVGELYAATAGIGFMITVAGATFQTDKVFVGVLIFALAGLISMELLTRLERRFDKWRPKVGAAE
jgi:NitT/TauT family transport system permease protein